MFSVPALDSTKIIYNKESVVNNSSIFVSKFNKKHSSIAYYSVRWNAAANVVKVAWIDTNYNLADTFTKQLTSEKRDFLFGDWTY